MRIQQPERLAEDIESGLGELHWLFDRMEPSMRLRSEGACGVGSLAVAQHFREQGYSVDLVISTPRLWIDPDMQHVLSIVHSDDGELMVDVSFSQFLGYAGMSEGYVQQGGENLFPDFKIAQIHDGDTDALVSLMTEQAVLSVEQYNAPDQWFRKLEMEGLKEDDIRAIYSAIWDPAYFDVYQPTELTQQAGKKLAGFILPEHVRLVA